MHADTPLIQRLFKQDSLQDVDEQELDQWLAQYPYFSCLYWLKARKAINDKSARRQAAAYAYYPRRLQHYLEGPERVTAAPQLGKAPAAQPSSAPGEPDKAAASGRMSGETTAVTSPLVLPLYTEDYFAFTRTRLPEHIENDKPPTMEQVRSFTGWLRMMKRNPQEEVAVEDAAEKTDSESGSASLRPREVVTESMAVIWEQHGQPEKAIAIYEKLILLNPEKSAYFAAKIRALKEP